MHIVPEMKYSDAWSREFQFSGVIMQWKIWHFYLILRPLEARRSTIFLRFECNLLTAYSSPVQNLLQGHWIVSSQRAHFQGNKTTNNSFNPKLASSNHGFPIILSKKLSNYAPALYYQVNNVQYKMRNYHNMTACNRNAQWTVQKQE